MTKNFIRETLQTVCLVLIAVALAFQATLINQLNRQLTRNREQREVIAKTNDARIAAERYLDKNENKKAIDVLRGALEKDPENPVLQLMIETAEEKLDSQ